MSIKTNEELAGMEAIGRIVGITLRKMREYATIGMSTKELDDYGLSILQSYGAKSAPSKDYDFPGCACISINKEVCHGVPKKEKIIRDGDLINIDVSAELNGFYGDNGGSFIIGQDLQNLSSLVNASQEILHLAIDQISDHVKISDVGGFIHEEARKRGFEVIRNICGHGIGRRLHEAPREIPCYKDRLNRNRFKKDSVIALETFISTNAKYVYQDKDGWTLKTKDKSFVAQHEHTLIVTNDKPIILTGENGI